MADRFWVGDSGNWSDNVNHWAASSGGAPNASKPTSADNVYFDANSFTIESQIVTLDETAYCLDMDWTGATNSPSFKSSGTKTLNAYGNITFISTLETAYGGGNVLKIDLKGETITVDSGGHAKLQYVLNFNTTISATLLDNLNLGYPGSSTYGSLVSGELDFNGFNVSYLDALTTEHFLITGVVAKILTMGASTFEARGWNYTGSNLTVTANTATINITGTSICNGGDADYNGASFNLNGTAHTVSGSFTCDTLALPAATTQTITITAGAVIKCTTATLSGDVTHAHTILSGTAGTLAQIWATNKTDSYVTYTDILRNYSGVIVSDCDGVGGGTFAGAGGTYTSLTIQGAGAYALIITGSNTFITITVDRSEAAKEIIFADGTTQTVTNFLCPISGIRVLTMTGTVTDGWTITKAAGGIIALNYLALSYSTATPALAWYAGQNSYIAAGAVSGWVFGSPGAAGKDLIAPVLF